MGQNASTTRDREDTADRGPRLFPQLFHDRRASQILQSDRRASEGPGQLVPAPVAPSSQPPNSSSRRPFATFSRHVSAQSTPLARGGQGSNGDVSTLGEMFYEQHEERPLNQMEDLGVPITHITASPMPRRSRLSRIGSMVVPRAEANGSASAQRNNSHSYNAEHFLPRRLAVRDPPSFAREQGGPRSRRASIMGTFSFRHSSNPRSRRRSEIAPISRPYPLTPSAIPSSPALIASSLRGPLPNADLPADPGSRRVFSIPLSTRLSGFRRSRLGSLDSPTLSDPASQPHSTVSPPRRPSRRTLPDDPDYLLPPLTTTDPTIDLSNAVSPNPSGDLRHVGISSVSESPERTSLHTEGHNWSERWMERGSGGRRESRRMPNVLRGRSSRLIRRDNDGPLPRILNLAASAIAAQLSGTAEQPASEMQAIGASDLDGSLTTLFRVLQQASSLTAHGPGRDPTSSTYRPAGALGPLNFLRVFRFVTQNTTSPPPNGSSATERSEPEATNDTQSDSRGDAPGDSEGRTVTLVVVGVRSVPAANVRQEERRPIPDSGLDSLLDLPALVPSANLIRSATGGMGRSASGRSRFAHRRRPSIGGMNTFPANYDSQRHQRPLSSSRPTSGLVTANIGVATPVVLSEAPPGPHPPPSTPADLGASAQSSQATTPSRRPSSASAVHQSPTPMRDAALRHAGISTPADQPTRATTQRRRSDSESARHRELGAGAARRNGVVGPDDVEAEDGTASGNRSWLIYVVGTNLAEDHPALTAPSLFTDVSILASSSPPKIVIAGAYTEDRILHMKTCYYCHPFWGPPNLPSLATRMLRPLKGHIAFECLKVHSLRLQSTVLARSILVQVSNVWYVWKNIGQTRNCANSTIVLTSSTGSVLTWYVVSFYLNLGRH